MITLANYEEYLVLYADRELRPEEERELMAFITKHPHLKKEMDLYEQTRVKPNEAQVFKGKSSLLKSETGGRVIGFPNWMKYSVAAGIAAFFIITAVKFISSDDTDTEMVKSEAPRPLPKDMPAPAAEKSAVAAGTNNKPDTQKATVAAPVAAPVAKVSVARKETQKESSPLPPANTPPVVQAPVQVNDLPLAKTNELPHDSVKIISPLIKEAPAYTAINTPEDNDAGRSFWDKLPIDETKKKQMKNIAGAVTDVIKDVNTAKQDLYKKSITIKIEKRRLIISF
jgi:hypothetical protein